ncbi:MAG: SDR family oxidoreductase [Verrucomicrobiales bacterium]|nr:SDR family oxidoreductase [Verrucomicrobiales bacterium]
MPPGRAGQPGECAESYAFLASAASLYVTGQVLPTYGGEMMNG